MVRHIIVLGSSFKKGKRIALDYIENEDNLNRILRLLKVLNERVEDSNIAFHSFSSESMKWEDLAKQDKFFEGVSLVKNERDFIRLIQDDKKLSSLDVADYILTKFKCTHTRLEKLTYFCYADYLCRYNQKLFDDKIYAFKYGPVIESIYDRYRRYPQEELIDCIEKIYDFPIKSRILISENGSKKLESIDATLEKYKFFTTKSLVDLTHKDKTPWAFNDKGMTPYKEIKDTDIIRFHHYEECE